MSPEYPQLQLLGYYETSEGVLKAERLKTVKFIKGRKGFSPLENEVFQQYRKKYSLYFKTNDILEFLE